MSNKILDPKNDAAVFLKEDSSEFSIQDSPTAPEEKMESISVSNMAAPCTSGRTTKPSKTTSKDNQKETPRRSPLGNLNTDLKSALNSWDVIPAPPPVQKPTTPSAPLDDVKKLLGELKNKLAEF